MNEHQYFTAEATACTIPKRGALAIYCGDAPRRNEADGTTSHSMRGPLLIIPPEVWSDPEGIAGKVAKVLNDHAHLFFESARAQPPEAPTMTNRIEQKAIPYGRCPDCGSTEPYEEATSATDEYRAGISLTCIGCGFAIAGPNEQTVRSAMAVLRSWNQFT